MKNNKELRVICRNGRYKMCYCTIDTDNEIEKIISDDIDMGFKSEEQFEAVMLEIDTAYNKPVVHVNRLNERVIWEVRE